jgi:hypothetical protein
MPCLFSSSWYRGHCFPIFFYKWYHFLEFRNLILKIIFESNITLSFEKKTFELPAFLSSADKFAKAVVHN